MKCAIQVLSILTFVIEVLSPTSRFIRAGAPIKEQQTSFYDSQSKKEIKKQKQENSDTQKSQGKKFATHKAIPLRKAYVLITLLCSREKIDDPSTPLEVHKQDILHPPIDA